MKITSRWRKTAAALGLGAALVVPVAAAPSAQAWGEVTYPGAGYAVSNTVYRDTVYCLGSNNGYWLEVQVDSVRAFDEYGVVRVKPFQFTLARIYHDYLNRHQYGNWEPNFPANTSVVHVQQRYGAWTPQTLVNEWRYEGNFSLQGYNVATFRSSDFGLDWTRIAEVQQPHMYFSVIARSPAYEVYSCTVPLGTGA